MELSRTPADPAEAPATRFWQKIGLVAEISAVCRRQRPDSPSFTEVLELIQRIIPFDSATLYLKNSESGYLTPQACLAEEVPLPGFLISDRDPRTGHWQTTLRKPLLWTREADVEDFEADGDYAATLAVPLLCDEEVTGVLILGSYVKGVLSEQHIKLMTVVADQLAISIERLERMAEIQARNEALREAHDQLLISQKQIIAAERLAAVVSLAATINHEINNPLAVIVGQVECLSLEEPDLSAQAVKRLKRVEQAAVKIGEVNRKLLNIDSIVTRDQNRPGG